MYVLSGARVERATIVHTITAWSDRVEAMMMSLRRGEPVEAERDRTGVTATVPSYDVVLDGEIIGTVWRQGSNRQMRRQPPGGGGYLWTKAGTAWFTSVSDEQFDRRIDAVDNVVAVHRREIEG
jgi:hypothetical protein